MSDTIWTIILAAVLLQGLFVAGVLFWSYGPSRYDARLLALLSLFLSFLIGEELIDAAGLYATFPHAVLSTFALPLAIGPLLLLIATSLKKPSIAPRPIDFLHFLPMLIVGLYLAPFYLVAGASKLAVFDSDFGNRIGPLVLFKGTHVLAYQGFAIITCNRLLKTGPVDNDARIVWFRRVLIGTFVPVVIVHLLYFFPQLGPVDSDRMGSLVVAVIVYSFAYAAMRWPFITAQSKRNLDAKAPVREKYRTSSLNEARKEQLRSKLLALMTRDEPFRDPHASLGDIATALKVPAHELSQVINEVMETNFHSFLNAYRIRCVQTSLIDPAQSQATLLQLAYDAGFNSKTSFNRVFKEAFGMTPSAYRSRFGQTTTTARNAVTTALEP